MKAVILDYSTMGPGLDISPLTDLLPDMQVFDMSTDDEVTERIRDVEFAFANKIRMSDELFRQASKLRFIGLTATGTDNIDLDSAARHDVAVCNIRGYCTGSVTEHVFGLLLTLTHNLHRYTADVRNGKWQHAQDFCMLNHPMTQLSELTMGVVGYGELGSGVARRAKDFGMDVVVAARPGSDVVDEGRLPFDEFLAQADVISLHCPLNARTENLFDAIAFTKMKLNAILINTARGGLIDSAALAAALGDGEIAAAAVDVLPQEPPLDGDPLLDYDGDNLLITPHVAWGTLRARQDAINELAANVAAFLEGEKRNRVV